MALHPVRTWWTVGTAGFLLAVGLGGALKAAMVGADYMYDLEQPHPALAAIAPAVGPTTPRLARRVVIAIVDGLRIDASQGLPYLDELRARGVDAIAATHYPTYSRPNYVTILTGVPPEASGVRTNLYSGTVALDSLMDRAHDAKMTSAYASDYDAMPRLFLRPEASRAPPPGEDEDEDSAQAREDERERTPSAEAARARIEAPMVGAFDDARYSPWPGGFVSAARGVIAADDDLVVLLVGVVDAAGHRWGGASDEYREAATLADRALRRALGGIDLSLDAVIVVADHGHTDAGGHGGTEPDVVAVPLVIAGAGVRPGAAVRDAHLIDVAPTAAALLGLPAPGHGLGRALVEALAVDDATRARIEAADVARIARNGAVVDGSIARARDDRVESRNWRLAVVAGLSLLAIALAWALRRFGGMRLDWHVLTVGVPAFFIVYYTAIGVLGQNFSPSAVPARGHISAELAKYGALGALVHMLAGLRALRRRKTLADRLAAANGIAWLGLLIAMVATGVVWAFYPLPYVETPGPKMLVLIPAVEIAVACYAAGVALTLVVEVIVFLARVWHRGPPASVVIDVPR